MRDYRPVLVILLAALGVDAAADAPPLEILGNPHAFEPVVAVARFGDCQQVAKVTFQDGTFVISLAGTLCSIPIDIVQEQRVDLGQLPAGRYRARMVYESPTSSPITLSPLVEFDVSAAAQNDFFDDVRGLYDEGGIWWSGTMLPGESIFIEHATASDRLYAVWNTYLADGTRDWRILLCGAPGYGERECDLFSSTRSGMTLVGKAVLDSRSFWTGDRRMTLRIGVGNSQRVIVLSRYEVDH